MPSLMVTAIDLLILDASLFCFRCTTSSFLRWFADVVRCIRLLQFRSFYYYAVSILCRIPFVPGSLFLLHLLLFFFEDYTITSLQFCFGYDIM